MASAIPMLGLRIHQGAVRDGNVMDMITLLRGSSLPGIIAGDNDEDPAGAGPWRRAERTVVMYKNSTLDVPERFEDAHSLFDSETHEMTGLQSLLPAIILPGPLEENLFANYETTAVDLQNSMSTITLPEFPGDEHLPTNSNERGTTG
ncbi:hypothetical protein BS47DRAFT_1349651 [Hydnum rufescens UP504]|uniref:Uncharacterized protein n=1 Tax=Hydnum rufescens UP504 TaxID=1448309 RepID=A0A9P6AP69_9AGAM|nr:hypothetical protein BS47DRAFT_1349651 [Hydnum rufescens UP504]